MVDSFSHPWLGGQLADDQTQSLLSPDAQLRHMLEVEATYACALGHVGRVSLDIAEQTSEYILAQTPDMTELRRGTALDGVVVPALVRTLKAGLPDSHHTALHRGLTSQDVIDTALILALKTICTLFDKRLLNLIATANGLDEAQGANHLMGRTRMQAALPITVSNRLSSWRTPLNDHLIRLHQLAPRVLCLQLGGAVGDRAALGDDANAICAYMSDTLGLQNPSTCWHSRRDNIAEMANWLSMVTGTLGKMGQDLALMAQQGIDDVKFQGGGGSSAMPHKQNPVLAELLVTLARFNATQLSGVHQAMIHEQERSGAAWTLEWMILPQMIMATGRALNAAQEALAQITQIGQPITSEPHKR